MTEPAVRCSTCGHRLGEWRRWITREADGNALRARVHLSAHWYPDGDAWQRGKRARKWNVGRGGMLPDDVILEPDGISLRPPITLACPVARCGALTTIQHSAPV